MPWVPDCEVYYLQRSHKLRSKGGTRHKNAFLKHQGHQQQQQEPQGSLGAQHVNRDQEVIKGQMDAGKQHTALCKEIDWHSTQEYEGQFPCKSGTSGKCPAADRYV